jgi:hypothetical protein
MMTKSLSEYFSLHRRYHRSVNLERDVTQAEAAAGYILTERASEAMVRIVSAFGNPKAHRAWTITGVYGTGKSAFAHYLTALCAPADSDLRQTALGIVQPAFGTDSAEWQAITADLPSDGLVRAVATGQREPLSWTIVRALVRGAELHWSEKRKPKLLKQLAKWEAELAVGTAQITNQQLLDAIAELVETAKAPIFLIIDELGKSLEFAAHNQGVNDLYLLQQIAELQLQGQHQVYFLGLLHQSFAGYSERLAAVEQSEWVKIQGRFEDIPFTESPSQMTRLIGQAIDRTQADPVLYLLQQTAAAWDAELQMALTERDVTQSVLAEVYPIHPLTALALPLLCTRYAQNDRSLFTFLTSDEPHAFQSFLTAAQLVDDQIPTLQLHQVYDYFVESVSGLASRINLQRWVEIQDLINDAQDQSPEVLKVLKTIGLLNLITTTGSLRATPQLVALALCDLPHKAEVSRWRAVIYDLQQRGLVTYRKQLDELRIWQGSDFNVEAAIYDRLEKARTPLAELLTQIYPLKPLVAQRHYIETGTLRYFEQRYADSVRRPKVFQCSDASSDGLIVYWLDPEAPADIPEQTPEGKPVFWVHIADLELLRTRAREFLILKQINKEAPELRTDGVARKEVKYRLAEAERLLEETLAQTLDWADGGNRCWAAGQETSLENTRTFQALLSDICDRIYSQQLKLDNELINRRELTSQGAKARRELIEAMIERGDQPRLGLTGYGPEVAMYYSLLSVTGIHRQEGDAWGFYPPAPETGVVTAWTAIEQFCLEAKAQQHSLQGLYDRLAQPPYGIKPGVIPVLLAAVLLHHVDDVGVYKDGTFIPVLGPEHFELLVKDPSRFSVKSFEMEGLRSQIFRELDAILRGDAAKSVSRAKSRNQTLLSIVKPLIQFVRKLPRYTVKTQRISPVAQAILGALQQTQEPDDLLFRALPQACGLAPITAQTPENKDSAKALREQLVSALREIYTAYDALLTECQTLLYSAFGVRSEQAKLRKDLQFRARYLLGSCLEGSLNRFVRAAADETADDRRWLEAVAMVIADKPAESWADEDVTQFELNLSDLARRFKNLEALQAAVKASGKGGFEARRLTVTRPDGTEVNKMVWASDEHQAKVDPSIDNLFKQFPDPQLQAVLLTRLTERMFDEAKLSVEADSPMLARRRGT